MGLTQFPNGISSFGVPVFPGMGSGGAGSVPFTLGTYFFVDSTTGNDIPENGTKAHPFATIDYAIGKCTSGACDVIIVAPGHTETISAAGGITLDVAGVTIVGLGTGQNRPTITLDTANTADMIISAANTTIDNLIFTANYADIAKCILTGAKDITIKNCSFQETATTMNFLSIIVTGSTNNESDGLKIIGNERISVDAAALAFVSILGNINRLTVCGNVDNQSSAADVGHFMICSSKVLLSAKVIGNILVLNGDNNAQTVGVFQTGSSSTSTGVFAYNLVGDLDATTELFCTASQGFKFFENKMSGAADKSGYLLPAADS